MLSTACPVHSWVSGVVISPLSLPSYRELKRTKRGTCRRVHKLYVNTYTSVVNPLWRHTYKHNLRLRPHERPPCLHDYVPHTKEEVRQLFVTVSCCQPCCLSLHSFRRQDKCMYISVEESWHNEEHSAMMVQSCDNQGSMSKPLCILHWQCSTEDSKAFFLCWTNN